MSGIQVLDRVTSIKVKLGLLVAVSVAVASVVATIGSGAEVPPWLGIPVTILLALGVTQLLAVGMTSPLRQMTTAARQMARGDYSGRVTATSSDEVGELARAFNRMAEDLATVDRQRRELVANVSHELRTPLAAMTALLENLADGVGPASPGGLEAALRQAERVSALVSDLLDLSRVDAGVAPLRVSSVAVQDLLETAVAEASMAGREVHYDVQVSPRELTVHGDPARLHQLVANLLDNASRHSPAGALVQVVASELSGQWRLEITDSGPGIAPIDRGRVFERFGTLSDQGGGGTGLGLAIARWVADLHGGSISFVDPDPDQPGARVRVDLPVQPEEAPMVPQAPSSAPPPVPAPAVAVPTRSATDSLFDSVWPERGLPGSPRVVLASLAVGLLAAVVLPHRDLGLGTSLVLLAAAAAVFVAAKNRRDPFTLTCAGLDAVLAVVPTVRAAEWIAVLCILAGGVLTVAGLVRGRTLPAFFLAGIALPLAGVRGFPWLGRSLRRLTGSGSAPAVIRTVVWSLLLVAVFGLLFASADALFAEWASVVLPDLEVEGFVLRTFVTVAVGGVVLAAAYLGINPPDVEVSGQSGTPVQRRFEWLAPVLLVDAVFVVFLVAQARVVFGGHDYLRRTTGLTYAEYSHQGFGQLTAATALTLLVVWAAVRKAQQGTAEDRAWLRASLGLLCVLTLVVVVSALHRMHLYQEAYGFTQLRLLVDVFEGWLGLLLLALLVAGRSLRAAWLPRMALLSGVGLLLGIAAINPDAWIAEQNIDRWKETGKVDWVFLQDLSYDAVPTLASLPDDVRRCALAGRETPDDDWLEWNLGRDRAEHFMGGEYKPLAFLDLDCPTGAEG
jgi:two-component system, OmpR family, sensor histidine kinase BaeS